MEKQRKGVGLTSFATGFAKGASQGNQMGMYRAMQQQKAEETEYEKKAKEILGYKTGIKDPKTLSELTIIAQELRRRDITPDEADNLMDAKGLTGPASFEPIVKQKAPEEEYHTFELTGTKPFTYNNIRHRPGDRISVKAIEGKVSAEAGGLKGTPFQFIGPTSTVSAVTPAPPRPPTPRAPALYIKPGTNEIISVSSRGAQYVTDTGESITAKQLATYTPYERKIKQYRYEKLNEKKEKIASQFVFIETIPTSEGFRYVAKTAIPTEDIIAGQDITEEWVDLSSRLKSRMEDPWDIMYKQPMGVDDTDSDDDLDRQTKEAFK